MRNTHHVLIATQRPPGALAGVLGPSVHLHFAAAADECMALASSLQPEIAFLDLTDEELREPGFVRMVARTLGPAVPLVGIAGPSAGADGSSAGTGTRRDRADDAEAGDLLNTALWDIWSWDDPGSVTRARVRRLVKHHRLRQSAARSKRKVRGTRRSLVSFLHRLEEIVAHPVDALEANLLLLYDTARRGAPATEQRLDDMACHLQEIRRTLARVRELAHSVAPRRGGDPDPSREPGQRKERVSGAEGRARPNARS